MIDNWVLRGFQGVKPGGITPDFAHSGQPSQEIEWTSKRAKYSPAAEGISEA
jgi:hypothetical protein